MNLIETKIQAELANLKIQTINFYWKAAWLSLLAGWILSGVGASLLSISEVTASYSGLFILFVFPVGFAFFLGFIIQAHLIRKKNLKKIADAKANFHHIYFENLRHLFPQNLQFEGIFSREEDSQHNFLNFSWGTEKIIWEMSQFKAKGGHNVQYNLTSTAQKVNGFDLISISEQKEIKDLYNFESIEFTKRFKVIGKNQIQIFNLLSPKIIENFLQQKPNFLNSKSIEIIDGAVIIESKVMESKESWVADPLDFSKIHWTKKKMTRDIFKKIKLDFDRYLENQKLLEPLELY